MLAESERVLKALSDANRLNIVRILSKSESMCAQDILELVPITQPTLSHHMKELVTSGLVKSERRGRWCYYSIVDEAANDFMSDLEEILGAKRA